MSKGTIEDQFNAMMNGDMIDLDESTVNEEDTDQVTESESGTDTEVEVENEDGTELDTTTENTEEAEDDGEEEDTLVDDDGDNSEDEGSEEDESDGTKEEKSEESTTDESELEQPEATGADTTDTDGGEAKTPENTDTIDPEEYARFKTFYENVALAKFKANGKEVEGFKDPADLIRAQQALHGLNDKMKAVKEYRPFIKALQDRGMMEDTTKFDLAMKIVDGDKEAIKKYMVDNSIDPLTLEMEDINYNVASTLPSKAELALDETFETARTLGVEDKVRTIIGKEWDDESFKEFVNDPKTRSDLLSHVADGTYDNVMTRVNRIAQLDIDGSFGALSSTDQYRVAYRQLAEERGAQTPEPTPVQAPVAETKTPAQPKAAPTPKAEESTKSAVLDDSKKEEYKKKVVDKKKEKQVEQSRDKAADMSAPKKGSPKKENDIMSLKGKDFKAHFNQMLMG